MLVDVRDKILDLSRRFDTSQVFQGGVQYLHGLRPPLLPQIGISQVILRIGLAHGFSQIVPESDASTEKILGQGPLLLLSAGQSNVVVRKSQAAGMPALLHDLDCRAVEQLGLFCSLLPPVCLPQIQRGRGQKEPGLRLLVQLNR